MLFYVLIDRNLSCFIKGDIINPDKIKLEKDGQAVFYNWNKDKKHQSLMTSLKK